MGGQVKAKGQRIRDIARILQSAGHSLVRGDAARVEAALGQQPVRTASVMASAKALGLVVRRGPSIEVNRREALRLVALGLVDGDPGDETFVARCCRALSDQTEESAGDDRVIQYILDRLADPLADTVFGLHHAKRETAFYAVVERLVCDRLMARLADAAEDLVLAQSEAHIDALATIATYAQAARLIERTLTDGGPGRSLVSRHLRKSLAMPTGTFVTDHVRARRRAIEISRLTTAAQSWPVLRADAATSALV